MTASVIQLHETPPCADAAATLRRIADDIEAGEHGDWPVTTAVLVIGHTDAEVPEGDVRVQRSYWHTYGAGPRCDVYTVRGLLMTAITRWDGGGDE